MTPAEFAVAKPLPAVSEPTVSIGAECLASLPTFREWSDRELSQLIGFAREWRLAPGQILFEEGSEGRSCFLVVRGRVDVALTVGHRRHLLSTIGPGTIFGEMSLLERLPRSATCAARSDAVVLEFASAEVERLLADRSNLALRFLGLLTGRLVATLRCADRRLLRASGVRECPETEAAAH